MKNVTIESVSAREIRDSRGNPTLAVRVTAGGQTGEFAVPSGASTGTYEARELRDGDTTYAGGKGVYRAIANVNEIIAPLLVGQKVTDQKNIDALLIARDGTSDKSVLGANAMIGASIAAAKAAAKTQGVQVFEYLRSLASVKPSRRFPYLYLNLINGGKHAKSRLAFQEYHLVPVVDSVQEALEIGVSVQTALEVELKSRLGAAAITVGDEGGFALDVDSVRRPLELMAKVVSQLHLENKVRYALDVAASSFFDGTGYAVDGKKLTPDEFLIFYSALVKDFNLLSVEDPFAEEDFGRFARLRVQNPEVMVVGDDLTVTNTGRLSRAIEQKSINGLIIKPNQIGTLSETVATIALARENNIHCIVSHRSGETMDDFISDLAVAFGCFGIKAGAPRPAERVAKYERLCAIERLDVV
ncbi:MAG: phosphopyruvate hydratase [bacterium]|nr:phosphopyruvate hydratase [bacterium]